MSYTYSELLDMFGCYVRHNKNSEEALREYGSRYPKRRQPPLWYFEAIEKNLLEKGGVVELAGGGREHTAGGTRSLRIKEREEKNANNIPSEINKSKSRQLRSEMKELEDKKSSKGRKRGVESDDDTEEAAGVRRRIKGKAGKFGGKKKKR